MSVDLYKKYGVTKEEVKKWAEQHYPAFLNAESVMTSLYLAEVRGVSVEPTDVQVVTGTKTEVKDLEEGTWCVLEVAVGKLIRSNSYMGCPVCYKSIPKEGPQECKTHGVVEPVSHTWSRYIAADNTGETVISLPPRYTEEYKDLMGSIIKARGVLNEQGEFNINSLNIIGGKLAQPAPASGDSTLDSGKPAETPLKAKATEFVDDIELDKFKQMMNALPSMALEDLEKWHQYNKIQTPLNILLMKCGAEEFDEGGRKKYRAPKTAAG